MGVSKTIDQIPIKIKLHNHSPEPPESSKAPSQDLKDIMFFAPPKSRSEIQDSELGVY